jgi:hypothetical protein
LIALTGDPDGQAIHGVFLGVIVKSSDKFDVRPFRKNWVSGTATEGAAVAQAQFIPAKGNRFVCRPATGQTVALASLNDLLAATPGAPDAYGNSTLSIDAASVPANAAAATVRVVDFVRNESGTAIAYVVELVNAA